MLPPPRGLFLSQLSLSCQSSSLSLFFPICANFKAFFSPLHPSLPRPGPLKSSHHRPLHKNNQPPSITTLSPLYTFDASGKKGSELLLNRNTGTTSLQFPFFVILTLYVILHHPGFSVVYLGFDVFVLVPFFLLREFLLLDFLESL
jgi:hypothetical protein